MELIGNILDWIDPDGERVRIGGYEDSLYQTGDDPYNAKNAKFDTLEELRLVHGITDRIMNEFKDHFTVYSEGKININTAPQGVIKGLLLAYSEPQISDSTAQEVMEKIEEMRSYSPFSSADSFISFVRNQGVELKSELKNYITVDSKVFRIVSCGVVGDTIKRIEAVIEFKGIEHKLLYYREE
jgi:general secretion pathway protein K